MKLSTRGVIKTDEGEKTDRSWKSVSKINKIHLQSCCFLLDVTTNIGSPTRCRPQQIKESIETCLWSVLWIVQTNQSRSLVNISFESSGRSKCLPSTVTFYNPQIIIIYIFCRPPNLSRDRTLDCQGKSQQNNDKLCVQKQNWLNCSGFCGLSVSYKQLVIAINKFRVSFSNQCPVVERQRTKNNKVFNKKYLSQHVFFIDFVFVREENLWRIRQKNWGIY